MSEEKHIRLHGRVIISGTIKAVTGLRIGGRPTGIEIGGVDNIVLRNPLTTEPYIPGSSLRGKLRSLYERFSGAVQNYSIDQRVMIHSCSKDKDTYANCKVCQIFGVPGDGKVEVPHPTPLVVRDVPLTEDSRTRLMEQAENFTEVKWEASIDRVTSAAVPRQMERVPAGSDFGDFELIYSIYATQNLENLSELFIAMRLLEDDYLGGLGSRGSGKVKFAEIKVTCMAVWENQYVNKGSNNYPSVEEIVADNGAAIKQWVKESIPIQVVVGASRERA